MDAIDVSKNDIIVSEHGKGVVIAVTDEFIIQKLDSGDSVSIWKKEEWFGVPAYADPFKTPIDAFILEDGTEVRVGDIVSSMDYGNGIVLVLTEDWVVFKTDDGEAASKHEFLRYGESSE